MTALPKWLRQWIYVTLADRGLATDRQLELAHKEGVIQGGIMALRLVRRQGAVHESIDRLEQNLLRQLDEVQDERLADIGLVA